MLSWRWIAVIECILIKLCETDHNTTVGSIMLPVEKGMESDFLFFGQHWIVEKRMQLNYEWSADGPCVCVSIQEESNHCPLDGNME